jgi:hypothetical protein
MVLFYEAGMPHKNATDKYLIPFLCSKQSRRINNGNASYLIDPFGSTMHDSRVSVKCQVVVLSERPIWIQLQN